MFIAILIVSLILTLALYFDGTRWLIPALASYAALIAIGYRGNQKLFFVPYDNGRDSVVDSQPGEQEKR